MDTTRPSRRSRLRADARGRRRPCGRARRRRRSALRHRAARGRRRQPATEPRPGEADRRDACAAARHRSRRGGDAALRRVLPRARGRRDRRVRRCGHGLRAGRKRGAVPCVPAPARSARPSEGRYAARLPDAIAASPAGFSYYAVLRNQATGATMTLPPGGASAPQRSYRAAAPVDVELGAHRFGATRSPARARAVGAMGRRPCEGRARGRPGLDPCRAGSVRRRCRWNRHAARPGSSPGARARAGREGAVGGAAGRQRHARRSRGGRDGRPLGARDRRPRGAAAAWLRAEGRSRNGSYRSQGAPRRRSGSGRRGRS